MLTPCARICVLDEARRMCLGCGRTLDEIAGWGSRPEAEQRAIMAQLPARLAALSASAGAMALRASRAENPAAQHGDG